VLPNSAGSVSIVKVDVLLIFYLHIFKVFCKAVYKSAASVVSLKWTNAANFSVIIKFLSSSQIKVANYTVSVASELSSVATE
jgi:hypothetical protein